MIEVGDVFTTNNSGDVVVTAYHNKLNVEVKFTETGTIKTTRAAVLRNGQLKDNMAPSVCGIGYLGYGDFKVSTKLGNKYVQTKEYSAWAAMIHRCYDTNRKDHTAYCDVTVCEEWCNFQVFAAWYSKRYFEGCELDKDLINKGARIYSPETCTLLSGTQNKKLMGRPCSIIHKDHGIISGDSQSEVSRRSGVPAATLSRLLSGKTVKTRSGWEVYND